MRDSECQRIGVKILADAGRRNEQHTDRRLRAPIGALNLDDAEAFRRRRAEAFRVIIEHLAHGVRHRRYGLGRRLDGIDGNLGLIRLGIRGAVFPCGQCSPVRRLSAGVTVARLHQIVTSVQPAGALTFKRISALSR